MNIALVNSWIMNGGDAGIIYGTLDALKTILPEARVTIFAHLARQASLFYSDLCLSRMLPDRWPEHRLSRGLMRRSFPTRCSLNLLIAQERNFYRELKEMDLIVYCGGGYLNDLYATDVLFQIMKDTLNLNIRHMGYAQSVGPFFKEASRKGVAKILNSFGAFTTRDQDSYDLLHQLGVTDAEVAFTADAAFAMNMAKEDDLSASEWQALDRIIEFKHTRGDAPLLFMSVREWDFPGRPDGQALKARYKSELQGFVGEVLSKTPWSICFISTCQGRSGYRFDDARCARALMQGLPAAQGSRVLLCDQPFRPRVYPFLISRCADLVLSMRMHLMIYSIMANVPFIGVAYEKKTHELAKQVGIQAFCHDLTELDGARLYISFSEAARQVDYLRTIVKDAYEKLYARSLENARILGRLLGPGS